MNFIVEGSRGSTLVTDYETTCLGHNGKKEVNGKVLSSWLAYSLYEEADV